MTPAAAARRIAFSIWHMARITNTPSCWRWTHDYLFGAALYAGALGNDEDESYLNELAEAADEIAAECR